MGNEHLRDDWSAGGSHRSRRGEEPWNKPEKIRSKISEKISWNGSRSTFREYRKTIEGHLLQVNAGYLVNDDFLQDYELQRAVSQHYEYLSSEAFWQKYHIPFAQAQTDRQYLYGILVIPAGKRITR